MAGIKAGKLRFGSGNETLQSQMEPSNSGVVLREVRSDFRSPHLGGRPRGIEPARLQGAFGGNSQKAGPILRRNELVLLLSSTYVIQFTAEFAQTLIPFSVSINLFWGHFLRECSICVVQDQGVMAEAVL